MEYAGVASLIVLTMCIGVSAYVAGYLIASIRARKQIAKMYDVAMKEIEKTHRTYLEYIAGSAKDFTVAGSSAKKHKRSNLKIIRSDKDQETPPK
jgi:hypothetical protein